MILFILSLLLGLNYAQAKCGFGQFLLKNKCVECPTTCSNCKSFTLSTDTCDGCSEGFQLSKDKKQCS